MVNNFQQEGKQALEPLPGLLLLPQQRGSWCACPTRSQGTYNQNQPPWLAQQSLFAAQPSGGHVLCGATKTTLRKEEILAILQGPRSFQTAALELQD